MLFVAGTRSAYLVLSVLAAIPVAMLYLERYPHARRRIEVFLAPEQDPTGAGYHIYQSLLAFGSGRVLGMGLGNGSQKLFFLPEPHTDFIFATIGQELGFLGASGVLLAFVVLVARSFWVAGQLPCRFPMFLTFGTALWLGVQAAIHMGVAVAVLPTKGLTLPLVSYGRTSMIVSAIAAGILLRASAEARAQLERRPPRPLGSNRS
jgi:cell division protein FtsW